MKKDLLRMDNLSKEEILDILNLADQLKYENKHGIEHHLLKGVCGKCKGRQAFVKGCAF